jgi:hypothetical protein
MLKFFEIKEYKNEKLYLYYNNIKPTKKGFLFLLKNSCLARKWKINLEIKEDIAITCYIIETVYVAV